MPQLIAVDSRLPPSTSSDPNDPTNPLKAIKDLKKVENQTNADTRYDIKGKLREGFSLTPMRKLYAILSGIMLALIILIFPQPLPVRIVLGVGVIYAIHYILGKFVK